MGQSLGPVRTRDVRSGHLDASRSDRHDFGVDQLGVRHADSAWPQGCTWARLDSNPLVIGVIRRPMYHRCMHAASTDAPLS